MTLQDLPAINAALNTASTLLLLAGFYFIRGSNRTAHRNCMVAAVTTSTVFLAGYLVYHAHAGRTVFREPAWFRPIYLAVLLSHTILAAFIVPLVIATLHQAICGRFERHRAIARWTWPVWLYVSVTGVLIYALLYRIFPQH
jgi:uncharacterized membrane protein YozB (DUF420 family)